MRKRITHLLIPALSVLILSVAAIFLLPKVFLIRELSKTIPAVAEQFNEDPAWILFRALDPEGKYRISGSMELTGSFPEVTNLEGTVETDLSQHRFRAEGAVSVSGKELELSLYLDPEYLAVASRQLTDENYYGITYNTFPEDIRSIPLLNVFITDAVFARWEKSLQTLQEQTSREYPMPYLPQLPDNLQQTLMICLLTLPCRTENQILTVNGETQRCRTLTYTLEEKQLQKVFPQLNPGTSVSFVFCLLRNHLAGIQCLITAEGKTECWFLQSGQNPESDPLTLQYTDDSGNMTTVTADIGETENHTSWVITEKEKTYQISYIWKKNSDKIQLQFGNDTEFCEVFLNETERGLSFRSSQLDKLFPAVGKGELSTAGCDLILKKSSGIDAPGYKNLNQWSLEDFLILAEGIGTWIGLRFN